MHTILVAMVADSYHSDIRIMVSNPTMAHTGISSVFIVPHVTCLLSKDSYEIRNRFRKPENGRYFTTSKG